MGSRALAGLLQRRERLKAIRGHAGLHAPGGKRLIQHPPIGGIVIHNQNWHTVQRHRRGSLRLRSCFGPPKSRREVESAPLARLALHPDPSLHHGYQARRNRQSQAGAAEPPGGGTICLRKSLEDNLLLLPRNADPGVTDREVESENHPDRGLRLRPAAALHRAP